MSHNTEFQVTDPVIVKPPHPEIQYRIVGRIVGINTDKDKNEYGILHYTRHFRNLQVINVAEDRLQKMPVETPNDCPSNNAAHAYIEDRIQKEKQCQITQSSK